MFMVKTFKNIHQGISGKVWQEVQIFQKRLIIAVAIKTFFCRGAGDICWVVFCRGGGSDLMIQGISQVTDKVIA